MRVSTFIAAAVVLLAASQARAQGGVRLGAHVERDGVAVRFVAGPAVTDVASDSWRATVQRIRDGEVGLSLLRSEEYRGRRDAGTRRRVQVCGRPAERVVIEHPEQRARPSFIEGGGVVHGREEVTPATIEVRAELEHRGLPVWILWTVRRDRRAAYRPVEDAFFGSIRCTSGLALGPPIDRDGIGIPFLRGVPTVTEHGGAIEQRVPGAGIVLSAAPDRARGPMAGGGRFALRVCDRMVEYGLVTRGGRTEAAVRVTHRDRRLRIGWSIVTAGRDRWRWLEDAFFASIRCAP